MRRILIILLLLPIFCFSQKKKERDTSAVILQPNRIEFELSRPASQFFVVNGEEKGLMVVEETTLTAPGGNYQWKVSVLDTAFQMIWKKKLIIPADGSLLGYGHFNDQYYLLFNKSRFRSEELLVYQFNWDNDQYLSHEISTVFPLEITHFEVVGKTILLAGYTNFRPVVITYSFNERKPKVVPGFYDNRNDILDILVDDQSRLFTVVMSEKMRNKRYTIRIKTFTENGDLIQDNLVNPGENRNLLDAASTTFSGGLQYMAGTHSKKSNQYSQGFYLSKFINGRQQFSKYFAFADLNNFFEHLKPKKEERIKRKIQRKRRKGKTKKFNYRLLVHEILERDEEYILVAEAYYPKYNYNSRGTAFTPYSPYSTFGTRTGDPFFLGYKYTHAVVVSFDANCNILWNHTFRIEDIQTYNLEENVIVRADGQRVILLYLEENEILSKVVEGDEVVEGRTYNPVKLSFKEDKLKNKDPNVEGIRKWYNNNLFAFGEQSIKNRSGVGGRTDRRVFYINKIQYDLDRDLN